MKHRSNSVLHCICFLVIFTVVGFAFTSLVSWLFFSSSGHCSCDS